MNTSVDKTYSLIYNSHWVELSSRDESPKRRAEIRQCPDRGEADVRRQNLANRIFEVLEPTEFAWVQN